MGPHLADLANERGFGPGGRDEVRIGEPADEASGLCCEGAVRGEEGPGRRETDRRIAGTAKVDGHAQTVRFADQRHVIVTSTFARAPEPPADASPCPRLRTWRLTNRAVEGLTLTLIAVIALAVVFDYINGFHDTANAIATSVATRALHPRQAILMAASFNFIGAFAGTAVATTIGAGLVDEQTTTQAVIAAALIGAITWNLITWYVGLPSSSSHALIGGLFGATLVAAGPSAFNTQGIVDKVLIPMVTSPAIGFAAALALMVALYWIFFRAPRHRTNNVFRRLQVGSAGFMAFSHGSNDAQKTMGIITLALFSAGVIDSVTVPTWVIIVSATALSLGTAVGGWRIMHTMGHRVVKLEPVHGFAAETTAASVLYVTATLGMPVSTTHVISSAIMGVGSARGVRGVRWGVARSILIAWVITIPAAGFVAAVAWIAMSAVGFG
jgi:inorganic phosphate transporter, PiT family